MKTRVFEIQPKDVDWARFGGLLDGEGTIRVHMEDPSNGGVNRRHVLKVLVVNNDIRLLQWCKDRFGGYIHTANKATARRRETFAWFVTQAKAEAVLRGCLEYLIVKRERAEVALALRQSFKTPLTGKRTPGTVMALRDEISQKLKALNVRGNAGPRVSQLREGEGETCRLM